MAKATRMGRPAGGRSGGAGDVLLAATVTAVGLPLAAGAALAAVAKAAMASPTLRAVRDLTWFLLAAATAADDNRAVPARRRLEATRRLWNASGVALLA